MAGCFIKLKSIVSSTIQKKKNILPKLKQSAKITNILKPLKDLEHPGPSNQEIFKDAPKYIQTKPDIKQRKERKN